VTVVDPKDINPFSEMDQEAPKKIPPLTVMSFSVRAIANHKENKHEVVCMMVRVWHDGKSFFHNYFSSLN
jgi:DNA polymerase alpha subunit A